MKLKYRVFFFPLLALGLLWYFRIEILTGVGNYLDASEEPIAVQRIFVLGGGNYDRGFKAARL